MRRKSGNGKGTNHYSPNLICQITMEIKPIAVIKKKRMRKRTFTLRMTTSPRSSPAKRARMSRRKKRSPANARTIHKRRPDRMEPTVGIPSVASVNFAHYTPLVQIRMPGSAAVIVRKNTPTTDRWACVRRTFRKDAASTKWRHDTCDARGERHPLSVNPVFPGSSETRGSRSTRRRICRRPYFRASRERYSRDSLPM